MPRIKHPQPENFAKIGESSRVIADFLAWAELQRGLALCAPYKPKYAWYTPTAIPLETLLTEFHAHQPEVRNTDVRAAGSGHGRPSRRAMLIQGK